jgi:Zn-dependent alcohol dehydrogenase
MAESWTISSVNEASRESEILMDFSLSDDLIEGRMPLDRLITRYDCADINRAAADATSGAAIKPVLLLPQ